MELHVKAAENVVLDSGQLGDDHVRWMHVLCTGERLGSKDVGVLGNIKRRFYVSKTGIS